MGNSIHRRLDAYDHDYHKPFISKGKSLNVKFKIISTNRLRVVFYYKKKPYTGRD